MTNRARAVLGALLMVAVLWTGAGVLASCATSRMDSDLLKAEKGYETALNGFNVVFTIEDASEPFLEKRLPGAHAIVEQARRTAKVGFPALLNAIDTYRSNGEKEPLDRALAVVDQALLDAQRILNPPESFKRQIGVGEILALLSAGRELVTFIRSEVVIVKRTGAWTPEERLVVAANWTKVSGSHAWLTDEEGGQ